MFSLLVKTQMNEDVLADTWSKAGSLNGSNRKSEDGRSEDEVTVIIISLTIFVFYMKRCRLLDVD